VRQCIRRKSVNVALACQDLLPNVLQQNRSYGGWTKRQGKCPALRTRLAKRECNDEARIASRGTPPKWNHNAHDTALVQKVGVMTPTPDVHVTFPLPASVGLSGLSHAAAADQAAPRGKAMHVSMVEDAAPYPEERRPAAKSRNAIRRAAVVVR
jgi:hypothetical protein